MKSYLDNLRPFEKRVVVGVGVMLFVVLNLWLVLPRFSDWGTVQNRRWEAQRKLGVYRKEIAQVPDLEKKLKELEGENMGVPPEEQFVQFSRAVQTQQARSGVNITGTSKLLTRTNLFFLELSQTVTLQSGEPQLVDFLYNLGEGNSLIRVRDLSLRPDPPRQNLSASVKLVASFQKKQPAKAAGPARTPGPSAAAGPATPVADVSTSTAKRP